ncbi:MAG: ABC transporter permease [Parvibaculaceae bacterium]|nr:ABC transporter permease [Parvibaculaceae bacterium]
MSEVHPLTAGISASGTDARPGIRAWIMLFRRFLPGLRAWMLAPSLLVVSALFLLPMAWFFVLSFWRLRSYRLYPDFSFRNYAVAWTEYLDAAVFTLWMSLTVAAITLVIAYAMAFFIRFRAGRFSGAVLLITLATLFGGYLVKIYAWKTILGSTGILNQFLLGTGLVSEPVSWLLYSPFAIIISLTHFLLPFAVLPIYASLRRIDERHIEAARDLGASNHRAFRDIILPQSESGIFVAFTIAFLVTAGDYVTPTLVGGSSTFMVGTFIQSQFVNRMNTPLGSALSFGMLASCLVILLIARALLRACLRVR